ncbi:MAG TPA: MOSC domain-containing protein [Tepidisphaeraceae bacterium]|nr:MOSC domain-containing protein [Tepidisphaeraceae bacterium]
MPLEMPILAQLNISPGGMPKLPIPTARITFAGVQGDRQKNRKDHSGPDRAICLFSKELYAELRAEGFDIHPGDLGENFTTRGIDLRDLASGDRLRVGECLIEITKVREPCRQLKRWHADPVVDRLLYCRWEVVLRAWNHIINALRYCEF